MRTALLLLALLICAAAPAAAQSSARAVVSASVTVVEPISFAAGPSTVAAPGIRADAVDVTTPLSIDTRAAYVLHVIEGEGPEGARATPRPDRPTSTRKAPGGKETAYGARVKLGEASSDGTARAAVTYVISTVN